MQFKQDWSASDAQILDRAQAEGRVVITADLDYPRLLALTKAAGPGLILLRGGNFAEAGAIQLLARAFGAIPSEEMMKSIVVIEKTRIRRRALPMEPGA
jgi:predicted nuclease of predicted toxin-antitoxin system